MIIYLITNKISNKKYVGQTVQTLEKRWKRHCWNSTLKRKDAMAITQAITKYGKENFIIEILEVCVSQELLNLAEQKWINELNTLSPNGYNLSTGGNSKGHLSDETKRKISLANIGKKISEETRKNLSESHKGWQPSEVTKEKWRKAFKGKKQTPEQIAARAAGMEKEWTFVNLNGEVITFKGLKRFCEENGLNQGGMWAVNAGRQSNHKGWKALKTNIDKSICLLKAITRNENGDINSFDIATGILLKNNKNKLYILTVKHFFQNNEQKILTAEFMFRDYPMTICVDFKNVIQHPDPKIDIAIAEINNSNKKDEDFCENAVEINSNNFSNKIRKNTSIKIYGCPKELIETEKSIISPKESIKKIKSFPFEFQLEKIILTNVQEEIELTWPDDFPKANGMSGGPWILNNKIVAITHSRSGWGKFLNGILSNQFYDWLIEKTKSETN